MSADPAAETLLRIAIVESRPSDWACTQKRFQTSGHAQKNFEVRFFVQHAAGSNQFTVGPVGVTGVESERGATPERAGFTSAPLPSEPDPAVPA
jgi:hypothetical protein